MQTLEIIGTLVGLLYLYFEYKASIWLWAASIVMPAIYIFVYRDAGFYADMGINVYYLLASGYGWAMWMRRSHRGRRTVLRQSAGAGDTGTDRSGTEHPVPDGTDADRRRGHGAASSAAATCGTGGDGRLANAKKTVVPAAQAAAVAETATISGPAADWVNPVVPAGFESTVATTAAEASDAAVLGTARASAIEQRRETTEKTGARPITHTPVRRWLPMAGVFFVAFGTIAFVLIRWTDSTVPYGDSFTTAMSIVGMWMLAQKYVEQWLVWIAVDVACTGLYLYKGLYPTAGLYALYTVIAVFGYFKWLRMMKTQNAYA